MTARERFGTMDVPLEGRSKNARYEGRFSGPGNPSDRSHAADGEGHVDVLRLLCWAPFTFRHFLPGLVRLLGHGMDLRPLRYPP